MSASTHPGAMTLRRLLAGELKEPEASSCRAHAETCPDCRARVRGLEDEQRRFEQEVSFERFAAGVERAVRRPRAPARPRPRWLGPLAAVAASCALALAARGLFELEQPGPNRIKGGAIEIRVAPAAGDPQRQASEDPATPEPLSPGERIRIGYRAHGHRYLTAISIDDQGEVTALYPESGRSLEVPSDAELRFLPDSLELTGEGSERVVVILTDEPLEVEAVARAARQAFEHAGRDVIKLDHLDLPGEQFHRTFLKP